MCHFKRFDCTVSDLRKKKPPQKGLESELLPEDFSHSSAVKSHEAIKFHRKKNWLGRISDQFFHLQTLSDRLVRF